MLWTKKPDKKSLTPAELDAFLQQERIVSDARKTLAMLLAAHAIFKEQVRDKYKINTDFSINIETGDLIDR